MAHKAKAWNSLYNDKYYLTMPIALLQLNIMFGDIKNSIKKIEDAVHQAKALGANICIAPELGLCGYPVSQELFYIKEIAQECTIHLKELITRLPCKTALIIGTIEKTSTDYYNSALLIQDGHMQVISRKKFLNTHPLFNEHKIFSIGSGASYFMLQGQKYIISIGHDITQGKPFAQKHHCIKIEPSILNTCQAEGLICLAAEPFIINKKNTIISNLKKITQQTNTPIFFVNHVGGNEQIIFFGGSTVLNKYSIPIIEPILFKEHTSVVSNQPKTIDLQTTFDKPSLIWDSIVLGIQDYARKHAFSDVVIGLSGGIDSSLTTILAVEALGAEHVHGILMPSPYSSKESIIDAQQLAKNFNIKTMIMPTHALLEETKKTLHDIIPQDTISGSITEENIQARLRCLILMSLSNMFNWLVLATGNKSELAVGYCTLYGDMGGGFAPICDLYKIEIYKLAHWYNTSKIKNSIPSNILTKEPSAELRPGQKDQDLLPPYALLDPILQTIFEGTDPPKFAQQELVEKITSLVKKNAFKRKQATPGIILTRSYL